MRSRAGISTSFVPACAIVHPPDEPCAVSPLLDEGVSESKVAFTVAAVSVMHVPTPVQPPPLHPAKVEPGLLVAVRVTAVPSRKKPLQIPPQSTPAGLDMTVPDPVPTLAITRVNVPGGGAGLKVAATVASTVS
jgi:hypothetical protein